jgi:hypothetical protein
MIKTQQRRAKVLPASKVGTLVTVKVLGRCPFCNGDIDLEKGGHRCRNIPRNLPKQIECRIDSKGDVVVIASSKELARNFLTRIRRLGVSVKILIIPA